LVNGSSVSNQVTLTWGKDFTGYTWSTKVSFSIQAQEATIKVVAIARDDSGNVEIAGLLNTRSFKLDLLNFATVSIISPDPNLGPFKTQAQTINITAVATTGSDLPIVSMKLFRNGVQIIESPITGGSVTFSNVTLGSSSTDTFSVVGIDSKGNLTAPSTQLIILKQGASMRLTCPDAGNEPTFNPVHCADDKVAFAIPPGVTGAKLKVYGIGGQTMANIQQSGDQLIWDGKKDDGQVVKNGVYLMRLEVNGKVQVVPIAVVK